MILAGSGNQDGSEIHESVLSLLALQQEGYTVSCFAPDNPQTKVINHLSGEPMEEQRNCLVEAARIARGDVADIKELKAADYDALMIPGGFGIMGNLSNYAADKEHCTVNEDLERVVLEFHKAKKPIGATCIAPAVLGKIFKGKATVTLTLGSSDEANLELNVMGMRPQSCAVDEMISDEKNKIYTTPCYMEPPDIAGMFEGIKLVAKQLGQLP